MIFQTLDTKKECAGIYVSGKIVREAPPDDLTATWKYTPHLQLPVEYANLYCAGRSIGEMCPAEIREQWDASNTRLQSFINACTVAKVDLEQNCFFDLVPQEFLLQYCDLRNRITEHVIEKYPKPKNYNFLLDLVKLLGGIGTRDMNVDPRLLAKYAALPRARALYKKLKNRSSHRVDYCPFKSKTGRLTTSKPSFPILTLDRVFRSIVKPTNDYFIELDFNAAELRTLLALSGKSQPPEDIHDWNLKNVYKGAGTRETAKKRIFAWLYNPESNDYLSDRAYSRDEVLKKYFDGRQVTTVFEREIPADRHHALNYIIQSTTSDLLLKRAIEIDKILYNRRSNVAFLLHDSLIIDFSKEDNELLSSLVEIFSCTDLGRYLANVSVGKDFGSMRRYR